MNSTPALRRAVDLVPYALLAAAAVLFAVSPLRSTMPWVNHDVAAYLHSAAEIAGGKTLYVDWIEINPPTIHLIVGGLRALAQMLGASAIAVVHLAVLLLGAVGLRALHTVLDSGPERLVLPLAYAFLVVGAGIDGIDFAQREHLFVIAFLPFLAWRRHARPDTPRAAGLAMTFATGLLATLKPQFVILLLVALVGDAVRRTDVRASVRRTILVVLALGMIAPVAAYLIVWPESLGGLLGKVVPFHLRGGYAVSNRPLVPYLTSPMHLILAPLVLGALAGLIVDTRAHPDSKRTNLTEGALLVLTYAFLLQQHKFFSYHHVPPAAMAVWILARTGAAHRAVLVPRLAVVVLTGLFLHAGYGLYARTQSEHATLARDLAKITQPGDHVAFLSFGLNFIYGPMYLDLRCAQRWMHDVVLPEVASAPEPLRHLALQHHADAHRERLLDERPRLVFVESYPRDFMGGGSAVTLLDDPYLQAVPRDLYEVIPADELPAFEGWLDGWRIYRLKDR